MSNKYWAVVLFFIGGMSWYFPGFNGFFFPESSISAGEEEIIGAIFFVGGVLLWHFPTTKGN